jgi:hypothetical protein
VKLKVCRLLDESLPCLFSTVYFPSSQRAIVSLWLYSKQNANWVIWSVCHPPNDSHSVPKRRWTTKSLKSFFSARTCSISRNQIPAPICMFLVRWKIGQSGFFRGCHSPVFGAFYERSPNTIWKWAEFFLNWLKVSSNGGTSKSTPKRFFSFQPNFTEALTQSSIQNFQQRWPRWSKIMSNFVLSRQSSGCYRVHSKN